MSSSIRDTLSKVLQGLAKRAMTEFGITNVHVVNCWTAEPRMPSQATECGEAAHPNAERALPKAFMEFMAAQCRKAMMHAPFERLEAFAGAGYLDADFRKGIYGLALAVPKMFGMDPFCGAAFVFRAKRADGIKLLVWDQTGMVLVHKRLEGGKFVWPQVQDGAVHHRARTDGAAMAQHRLEIRRPSAVLPPGRDLQATGHPSRPRHARQLG